MAQNNKEGTVLPEQPIFGGNRSARPIRWGQTHPDYPFGEPLQDRVERLEIQFAAVVKLFEGHFGPLPAAEAHSRQLASKRGPASRLPIASLLGRRDSLIQTLEPFWPELRPVFERTASVKDLVLGMRPIFRPQRHGSLVQWIDHLKSHAKELRSFLHSCEYTGDPRQIANAMAGLPEYTWTTSLKLCRRSPSDLVIHKRALRDYLQRKYSRTFLRLLRARTVEEVERAMKSRRTNDPEFRWLVEDPAAVVEAMEMGRPGWFQRPLSPKPFPGEHLGR